MPRVTALLYVKNSQENLTRCLTSLSNQILDDLEILCIDDNSSDGSTDILENYAKKETHFKLVKTKDVGFGRALSQGIKSAHGEYVAFVMPKDIVDPAAFIDLFALAKKHEADLVRCNYYEQKDNQDILRDLFSPEETDTLIDPTENTRIFYLEPAIWAGLYRKDYLQEKKLFFLNHANQSFGSISFNFKTLVSTSKIIFSDKAYTHHKPLVDSSELFNINKEYSETEQFLKDKILWKTYGYVFQAVKFSSYYQYMQKLTKSDLRKFVLRARAEFHDADNHRLLFRPYFLKGQWRLLKNILDLPINLVLASPKFHHIKIKKSKPKSDDDKSAEKL